MQFCFQCQKYNQICLFGGVSFLEVLLLSFPWQVICYNLSLFIYLDDLLLVWWLIYLLLHYEVTKMLLFIGVQLFGKQSEVTYGVWHW